MKHKKNITLPAPWGAFWRHSNTKKPPINTPWVLVQGVFCSFEAFQRWPRIVAHAGSPCREVRGKKGVSGGPVFCCVFRGFKGIVEIRNKIFRSGFSRVYGASVWQIPGTFSKFWSIALTWDVLKWVQSHFYSKLGPFVEKKSTSHVDGRCVGF